MLYAFKKNHIVHPQYIQFLFVSHTSIKLGKKVKKKKDICRQQGRVLSRNQTLLHIDLELPASRTVRSRFLWVKPPSLCFVMAA